MLIDHFGLIFFPQIAAFRIIGRLAFPVFSYSIYEGCKYTRSKLKYFLRVFILGFFCAAVYFIYDNTVFGNILITFSLSICLISSLKLIKTMLSAKRKSLLKIVASFSLFIFLTIGTYFLCEVITVDYGFFGIFAPVLAELFDFSGMPDYFKPKFSDKLKALPLVGFSAGLILTALSLGGVQYYSFLALPLLLFQNKAKSRGKLKCFFYVFYPLHLALLELLAIIIKQ